MFVLEKLLFVAGRRIHVRDAHTSQGCRLRLCLEGDGFWPEEEWFGWIESAFSRVRTEQFVESVFDF